MTEINNMSDIKTDVERIKAKILNYEFITESDVEDLITTIESQKEEIEEFRERYTDSQFHVKALSDVENVHIAEIESLKAITELAVKGLREIVKGDESYHTTIFEARDWIDKIEVVAGTALSEIERLQNDPIS